MTFRSRLDAARRNEVTFCAPHHGSVLHEYRRIGTSGKVKLREGLWENFRALVTSAVPDCDGDEAVTVDERTKAIAEDLIEALPNDVDDPSYMEIDPEGAIEFDWGESLSINVEPGGVVSFSFVKGAERVSGEDDWKGELPHFVRCALRRIAF